MIIADTGFWVALAMPDDRFHERARCQLAGLQERLVVTWPVITETCHLLGKRVSRHAQQLFLQHLATGVIDTFDLRDIHLPRVIELMQRYANLPMDLADASLVVLAEHLGDGRILSTDMRDFGAYRWKNTAPFRNLLAD